jgi:hypothetical protein
LNPLPESSTAKPLLFRSERAEIEGERGGVREDETKKEKEQAKS